jgi:hypothetical protein
MSQDIPQHFHFIWIGAQLPFFARMAIESALQCTPDARATLWASEDLSRDAHTQALLRSGRFVHTKLDQEALFKDAPTELPLDALAHAYANLSAPAARANIARLLVLAQYGGIYLDTDTTTLRDLAPLFALPAFCGLERVIWPLEKRYGLHPYRVIGGPLRGLVRNACARMAGGVRAFRRVERFYPTALNNAVFGFPARHPFLTAILTRISELPEEEQLRRYRLGTHLLQETFAALGAELGVVALPPSAFYPLGPEISRHYFRVRDDVASLSQEVIGPDTYLIHWYASVSELNDYDAARVNRERDQTLFAHVTARYTGGDALTPSAALRQPSA